MTFLAVLSGLGFFRFQAASKAYYLDSLNISIQQAISEEMALKQEISALAAPIKIYSYCKEFLGMQKVAAVEVLPVPMRGVQLAEAQRKKGVPEEKESGWSMRLAWLWGE
ncbi:MAG: hypothetical protein K6E38_03920 [Fretibacterium sp.]|nr:hypothetical protein [Fretibacterium sp.]